MIPLTKPYTGLDELNSVAGVLESGWLAGGGSVSKVFSKKVCDYLGVSFSIPVSNATSGLHVSLKSLGVGRVDEVIVSDYTYPATGLAVLSCGATPVFVDVDEKTYNINPANLEESITSETKAIIPVHAFGHPADMDEILRIGKKYDLPIVEDAACAFGSKYKERFAGTIGDTGCFSFHARKIITTGEGGMVVTGRTDLPEKITKSVNLGSMRKESSPIQDFNEIGFNFKLSDINCAVGIAQLDKLERIIERRRVLADYWSEGISSLDFIRPPFESGDVTHTFQSYVAVLDSTVDRDKVIKLLGKGGVEATIGSYACHTQPVFSSKSVCPVSKMLFNSSITLPLYHTLSKELIDSIIPKLRAAIEASR